MGDLIKILRRCVICQLELSCPFSLIKIELFYDQTLCKVHQTRNCNLSTPLMEPLTRCLKTRLTASEFFYHASANGFPHSFHFILSWIVNFSILTINCVFFVSNSRQPAELEHRVLIAILLKRRCGDETKMGILSVTLVDFTGNYTR